MWVLLLEKPQDDVGLAIGALLVEECLPVLGKAAESMAPIVTQPADAPLH